MDLDQLQRVMAAGAVVAFALMVLGIVGEILGWWNDFGEMLITFGAFLGLVLTLGTYFVGATNTQARGIASGVREGNLLHDRTNRKLDDLGAKQDRANASLADLGAKQDRANASLADLGAKQDVANESLARIAATLGDIRDRLPR